MLGRYDISLKCVEIRRLLDNRNYKKALSILETLDTDKVKNITDLNAFADVYRKTEQYDLAEEMLLRVYEKSPTYRVIYKLVIVSLKKGNLSAAEDYYKDYIEVAPEIAEKYILEYRVKKAKHSDYKDRIQTLEELKKIDYMEEWAYELAKLYHKAGMSDQCIAECDDIVLWFSEGIIVEKAKMLRAYYIDGADILNRTRQRIRPISQPAKEIKSSKDMILNTMDLSAQISELKDNEHEMEVAQQLAGDLEPTVDVGKVMQQELVKESESNEKVDLYDIQERREKRKNRFFRNENEHIEEDNSTYVQEYSEENLQQEQLFWGAEELAATQEAYQLDMEPDIEEQSVDMQTGIEEPFIPISTQLEEEQYIQEPFNWQEEQLEQEEELSEDELRLQMELNEGLQEEMVIQSELNIENSQEEFTESNWNQSMTEEGEEIQSDIYQEDTKETFAKSDWSQPITENEEEIQSDMYQEDTKEEFAESNWDQPSAEEIGIQPELYEEKIQDELIESNKMQEVVEEVEGLSEVNKEVLQEQISPEQEIDVEAIRKTYSQKISVKLNSAQKQAVLQSKIKAKELQESEIKETDENTFLPLPEKAKIQNQETEEKALKDDFTDKTIYNEQIEQEEQEDIEKNTSRFLVGNIDVSIFLEQYAEDELLEEQLHKLLEQLENTEEHPHFLVTANQEEDAIEFTKNLAKVLQKIEFMRSSRIAKIQAMKLNRMNLEDKQSKLIDSTLLIEKAGEMYRPTVTSILALLKEMNDRLTVVLQGTYQEIEILLEENYDLREAFLYRIDL